MSEAASQGFQVEEVISGAGLLSCNPVPSTAMAHSSLPDLLTAVLKEHQLQVIKMFEIDTTSCFRSWGQRLARMGMKTGSQGG